MALALFAWPDGAARESWQEAVRAPLPRPPRGGYPAPSSPVSYGPPAPHATPRLVAEHGIGSAVNGTAAAAAPAKKRPGLMEERPINPAAKSADSVVAAGDESATRRWQVRMASTGMRMYRPRTSFICEELPLIAVHLEVREVVDVVRAAGYPRTEPGGRWRQAARSLRRLGVASERPRAEPGAHRDGGDLARRHEGKRLLPAGLSRGCEVADVPRAVGGLAHHRRHRRAGYQGREPVPVPEPSLGPGPRTLQAASPPLSPTAPSAG